MFPELFVYFPCKFQNFQIVTKICIPVQRIQLLYRPPISQQDSSQPPTSPVNSATLVSPVVNTTATMPVPETTMTAVEDPPPKYTPPPSYTTATGAR
jgi:solute carrier family 6 (neurotransmitter transporter)